MSSLRQQRLSVGGKHTVALTLCLAAVYVPVLIYGLPAGNDALLHHAWVAAFVDALDWSNLYPRWLPSLWGGMGSADFYFYPPLGYYPPALISALCAGCDSEWQLVITLISFRLLGALAMMGLAQALGRAEQGIAAACVWILSPYHSFNFYHRMAYGELLGSALLPLVLWGLLRCLKTGRWGLLSVSTALLMATHLLSVVMITVVGTILALGPWRPSPPLLLGRLGRALGAGVLALGITAISWLPGVWLLDTVQAHFLQLHVWWEHIFQPGNWMWKFSSTRVLQPFVVLSIIALLAVSLRPHEPMRGTILTILATVWILVTPVGRALWDWVPGLQVLQFPWRFLGVADVALALALPLLTSGRARRLRIALGCALAITAAAPVMVRWTNPAPLDTTDPMVQLRLGASEWLSLSPREGPRGQELADAVHSFQPPPPISTDRGAAQIVEDRPRELIVSATCPVGCTITLARSYWKYWYVETVEGSAATIAASGIIPTLTLKVAPEGGVYRLTLRQPRVVWVGLSISLLSILLLAWLHLGRRLRPV